MNLHRDLIGVVDDDPRVLESFEEFLAAGGYKPLPFVSAEKFLDANGFEQVDCPITDIGMPGMTGWELPRGARRGYPDLPVIVVTARVEENTPESLANREFAPFFGSQSMAGRCWRRSTQSCRVERTLKLRRGDYVTKTCR